MTARPERRHVLGSAARDLIAVLLLLFAVACVVQVVCGCYKATDPTPCAADDPACGGYPARAIDAGR